MSELIKADYRNAFDEFGDMLEDLEDIYDEYKDQIDQGSISEEALEKILGAFVAEVEYKEWKIKDSITDIYTAIISIKHLCSNKHPDLSQVKRLVGSVHALRSNLDFMRAYEKFENGKDSGHYNIPKLCEESYTELFENTIYGTDPDCKMKPYSESEEEFKPEHLLDLEWHFKNFQKIGMTNRAMDIILNRLWLRNLILYV